MTSTYNTATDPVESTAVSTSISQAPTTKAEALESWKSEVNAAWDTHFPALNAARERAEKCELESADNVCKYLTKFTENLSNLTKRGTMPLKNESSRLPNLMSLAISAQHNLKALERELGRESDFDETIRWDIKEAAWKAQESMFPLFAKRYGIQRGLIPSEKFKNDNATLWWKQQCDASGLPAEKYGCDCGSQPGSRPITCGPERNDSVIAREVIRRRGLQEKANEYADTIFKSAPLGASACSKSSGYLGSLWSKVSGK